MDATNLELMKKKHDTLSASKKAKTKVADFPAFGMWANRSDMADPVAYVVQIRKQRLSQFPLEIIE